MLSKNKANVKSNYPFAIVAINITLLLGEQLGLRDHKYVSSFRMNKMIISYIRDDTLTLMVTVIDIIRICSRRYLSQPVGYWDLFNDSNSFFELFCICFLHVDNIWTFRNAIRADFAKIIGEGNDHMLYQYSQHLLVSIVLNFVIASRFGSL
jgi:hypothetical protein